MATMLEPSGERQLRILVMMPGTPYAEDRENRRRQRHAVVSALTENDYVPEHERRLGYFTAPCFERSDCLEQDVLIGFESYEQALETELETERESDVASRWRWGSVVVLWLNSEDFRTCALHKVTALTAFLNRDRRQAGRNQATTVLVGPVTSGALADLKPSESSDECNQVALKWHCKVRVAMCPEAARGLLETTREKLHVLSPRATAPLDLLFGAPGSPPSPTSSTAAEEKAAMRDCLKARSVTAAQRADKCLAEYLGLASFESVVARDDVVLRTIVDELRARGASRLLMAIVSEQDSAYGRLLDDVLEELLGDQENGRVRTDGRFDVREYGYLAGVDGEMPPDAGERDSEPERRVEPTSAATRGSSFIRKGHEEVAFGEAQLDYVRRLADRIAYDLAEANNHSRGDEALGDEEGTTRENLRISRVAIGVLGSDVYDKLLILEALRARLPAATYFTTDLDARLSHPDVYASTRNLIVGSAYGLTVKGQKGAAFRDSYQTATYRAVALALETHDYGRLLNNQTVPYSRLFEIGRTGAVDITQHESEAARKEHDEIHGGVPYIRSRSSASRRIGSGFLILTPLLALIVFALASREALPEKGADLRRKVRLRVAWVGGMSAGVLSILMWVMRDRYEPWPFLEGVSSLPTLVLYLTTLVYAYAVVAIAMARIEQAEQAFAEDWKLGASTTRSLGRASTPRQPPWIGRWKQDVTRDAIELPKRPATACWALYSEYAGWRARMMRVSIPFGVSVLALLVVVFRFSLPAPLLTRHFDGVLSVIGHLTAIAVLLAVFFCDDALRLGRAMLREIGRHEVSDWPGVGQDYVRQRWRTMRFLERFTDSIMPIAALPFVLLALLVLARSTLFEGWVWTTEILLLYSGFVVYVVVRTLRFQFEAVKAKDAILTCLDRYLLERIDDAVEKERVELVKERIAGVSRGAFGPWTRHPILRSVLVPSLAYAVVVLLEAWL